MNTSKTKVNKNLCNTWGIKRQGNGRYILIDTETGDILDDMQGVGFKTNNKAYAYGHNKYQSRGKCNGEPNTDDFITLI